MRRSNVFPKLPVPELGIVQIEDESHIVRFPFGKVVQHKKIEIVDGHKIEQLKEIGKKTTNRDQLFFKFACYEEERKPDIGT